MVEMFRSFVEERRGHGREQLRVLEVRRLLIPWTLRDAVNSWHTDQTTRPHLHDSA